MEITALVTAGGGGPETARAGIIVREHIPELRERLAEYDLLVTHFGLTAFEALHARLPVVLLSPAACHARLARLGGFPHGGVGPKGARLLPSLVYGREKALGDRCRAAAAKYGLENPQTVSLGDFLAYLSPRGKRDCPVCGAVRGPASPVIARFPNRSYRRCGTCGIVYMLRDSPPTIEYEADYFFDFYKSQYGKTYLEDFSNLTAMGKRRLATIKALGLNGGMGERLLDIGCAYGPFLAAARDEGFVPEGMDIASDAVRYIREELHIPARTGVFPDNGGELWQDGRFTVVSLWYVIEHFEDLVPVLKEINRLLKRGGVLAFSTPSFTGISGTGISGRSSPNRFLEKSPGDHYTVWSPGQCGKLLARYGFELKKVVITGHHPERFPLAGRLFRGGKGPLHGLLLWISRIFGLGDTFEAYAVKREDCHGTK